MPDHPTLTNHLPRFGMLHPGRVHGLVTINNSASTSLGRCGDVATTLG